MTYPIPIMKLAAEVPKLYYKNMQSWQELYQLREHPDETTQRLTHKAADRIAHEFVSHVMKKMEIKTYDEAEGRVTRFICVAMSHQELADLLYRAYVEGQSDGLKRAPVAFAG